MPLSIDHFGANFESGARKDMGAHFSTDLAKNPGYPCVDQLGAHFEGMLSS